MANKFAKVVEQRQRLEQMERENANKKEKNPPRVREAKPREEVEVLKVEKSAQSLPEKSAPQELAVGEQNVDLEKKLPQKTLETQPQAGQLDLSDFIVYREKRDARNKTFYLDREVIEALGAACKKQHIAESRLVNDILKKVLGVPDR